MSRIGNKPVVLPKGVTFSLTDGRMVVKGPKGELSRPVVGGVEFSVDGDSITISRHTNSPQHRANHGLMRSLLFNMVTGVSQGFERRLEIVGVGYKAETRGQGLLLNLGFSHPIEFTAPDGVSLSVEKNGQIVVTGVDKEAVGQAAAVIRGFRPPDSYKGKGVRYLGEHVRKKAGKSGQ